MKASMKYFLPFFFPKNILNYKGISIAAHTLLPSPLLSIQVQLLRQPSLQMSECLLKASQSITESQELTKTKNSIKQYRQYMKNIDCTADIKIFKNYAFSRLGIAHHLILDKAFVECLSSIFFLLFVMSCVCLCLP